MTYYVFRNAGVIDPRSITTFGVSSKEANSKPIGFFGTGLKYAIAVLLRNKCQITIFSGEKTYEFGVSRAKVRNDEFEFIQMNGQDLGFTTELGKTWEMWQAFRELACNAIDEKGEYYAANDGLTPKPMSNETMIIVSGSAFEAAWGEKDSIILSSEPMIKNTYIEAHFGKSNYAYYRGVRVAKLERTSVYTYNITAHTDLTEDRTLRYAWKLNEHVVELVKECAHDKIIKEVVTATPNVDWEASLYFSGRNYGPVFRDTVLALAKKFTPNLNATAKNCVQAGSLSDLLAGEVFRLSKIDQARIDKASAFLAKLGYDTSVYPIRCTEFLGDGVLGAAQNDTIYISKRALMMGTKMLAGTILEEYLHLKHGVRDETREMQNFLIDALMSMGEQLIGEPL